MAKQVSGWLTDDGQFYLSEAEARRVEARDAIIEALHKYDDRISSVHFLETVDALAKELNSYLGIARVIERHTAARERASVDAKREGNAEAVVEQPAGGQ